MNDNVTKDDVREIISESVAGLMYTSETANAKTEELLKKIESDVAALQETIDTALSKIEALELNIGDNDEKAVINTL